MLVVVFQVYVVDFASSAIDAERQTTVSSHAQTPSALPVAHQRVYFPDWQRAQFLWILHIIEKCQHFAELVYRIGRHTLRYVICVECFQALVREAPYFHSADCSLLLNTCQCRKGSSAQDTSYHPEVSTECRRYRAKSAQVLPLIPPNIYNRLNKLAFPRSPEPRSVAVLPHAEVCPPR